MKNELVILPDAYGRRIAVFVFAIMAVLALLFWASGISGSNAVAAFSFTAVMGLCGLLSFETRISEGQRCVARVWRLGGVIPVWRRAYHFDDLRGVQQLWFADAERDVWKVGLVTASGRFLMVTYFNSRTQSAPAAEAQRFQDYLARTIGVPVLELNP
jgi:hypothetical protein